MAATFDASFAWASTLPSSFKARVKGVGQGHVPQQSPGRLVLSVFHWHSGVSFKTQCLCLTPIFLFGEHTASHLGWRDGTLCSGTRVQGASGARHSEPPRPWNTRESCNPRGCGAETLRHLLWLRGTETCLSDGTYEARV